MKKLFASIVILLAGLTIFSQDVLAQEIIFAGSTTVQKRILEPAANAIKAATGVTVKVLGVGTGGGFKKLKAGEVQVSIASSSLSMLLKKAGIRDNGTYQEHIIMTDIIVPIVNRKNSISKLSWEQLAGINAGKITNWKKVGGPDLKIMVVTSHSGSATREVFEELVMKKAPYIRSAMTVNSTREEVDLVSKLAGSIGAVSEGFVKLNSGKVKVIKSNKISRPLSIITKGNPSAKVKAVIDFLKSAKAQKLFK